ncbi:MAG: hypothetical protein AVDCRST_MAG96-2988 [uncultured Segetibacter sp.]|uniref:Uncharacterized protein n=1 Tax=uncultured Segetibacter sp. TaxID=481133 RepID=A0A6J4TFA9_9BACT|nr:MAG: hypothetical protein AVDCRST_MAG96-2988 [uncultured Segetibacter sp.]
MITTIAKMTVLRIYLKKLFTFFKSLLFAQKKTRPHPQIQLQAHGFKGKHFDWVNSVTSIILHLV